MTSKQQNIHPKYLVIEYFGEGAWEALANAYYSLGEAKAELRVGKLKAAHVRRAELYKRQLKGFPGEPYYDLISKWEG